MGGTLPATDASVSTVAPTWTPGVTNTVAATPLLTKRVMDQFIGGLTQTSLAYATDDVVTNQRQPLLAWVSPPLAAQTIAQQVITLRGATSASNTSSVFSISWVLAVWRPGTGALVGRVYDGVSLGVASATAGTSQAVVTVATTSGNTTAVTAQDGDVLVLEIWRSAAVQSMAASYTNTVQYDGQNEASTSNNASHIEFTNNVTLAAPTTIALRGTTWGNGQDAAWVVTLPSGTTDGDFVVVALMSAGGTPVTVPAPAGWTRFLTTITASSYLAMYTAPFSASLTLTFAAAGASTTTPWVCSSYTPPTAGQAIEVDGTPVGVVTATSDATLLTGAPTTGSVAGDYEVLAYGIASSVAFAAVAAGSTIDRLQVIGPSLFTSAIMGHNNTASLPATTTVTAFNHTLTSSYANKAGVGLLLRAVVALSYRNLVGSAAGVATVSVTISRRRALSVSSTGVATASGTVSKTTPGGGGPLFSDDFNRANGALGGNWVGTTGTAEILSNQVRINGSGVVLAVNTTSLGTVDYEVKVDLTQSTLVSGVDAAFGLVVRYVDANNFYNLQVQGTSSGRDYALFRVQGGSYNELGRFVFGTANADPVSITLRCHGSVLVVYVNGTERLYARDATHTTGGFALYGYNASSVTGHRFDNVVVNGLVGIGDGPVFTHLVNQYLTIRESGGAEVANLGVGSAPYSVVGLIRLSGDGFRGFFQNGKGTGGSGGDGFWTGVDGGQQIYVNIGPSGAAHTTSVVPINQWALFAVVVRGAAAQSSYVYNFNTATWQRTHDTAGNPPVAATGFGRIGNYNDALGDAFSEWLDGDLAWVGLWAADLSDGGATTPTSLVTFVNNGPWTRKADTDCRFFVALDQNITNLLDEAGGATASGRYALENTVPIGFITAFPNPRPTGGGPTYKNLTGSTAGVGAVTVQIVAKRSLTASSVGIAVASASVKTKRALVASAAGVTTLSVQISKKRALIATSVGVATVSVAINRKRALASSVAGIAVATATASRSRPLVAASVGISSASGVVTKRLSVTYKDVTGAASGSATTTVTIIRGKSLTASAAGTAATTATTSRRRALTASSAGVASVTVSIRRTRLLAASASGLATVSVALNAKRRITASATGVAVSNALLSKFVFGYQDLIASASGTASTAAAIVRKRALAASSVGVSSVIVAISRKRALTASVVGVATVAVTIRRVRTLAATSVGVATTGATVRARRAITGSATGASVSNAVISKFVFGYKDLFVNIGGVATTSATIVRRRALSATSSGLTSVAAFIGRGRRLVAASVGSSSVSVQLRVKRSLAAIANGSATANAVLSFTPATYGDLIGSIAGVATVSVAISRKRRLVASSAVGRATASGTIGKIRSTAITSPGPDIVYSQYVVPVIYKADHLVPYVYQKPPATEPMPVITSSKNLVPYLYSPDAMVPNIVWSEEV